MKNLFITKSNDFKSFLVSGQTSKQYSRTGRQLLLTSCNTTSSEDMRPTLPKIALTVHCRVKAHLASYSEHSNIRTDYIDTKITSVGSLEIGLTRPFAGHLAWSGQAEF